MTGAADRALAGDGTEVPPGLDSLSVVVPVYNEPTFVRTSLEVLLAEGEDAGVRLDVVVVDDGSTDETPAVLDEIAATTGIRVVHQPNGGRMAARRAGVELATEPLVLLLDSRVIIRPGALTWLRAQRTEHPERLVWSGHAETVPGNPYAAFWTGLARIGWRAYTSDPRLVSFGVEDFDRYPKGTGCLVIPRATMLRDAAAYRPVVADERLSSDDTRLLRAVAAEHRIWLSPDFRFDYHGKQGMRGFVRQAFFRGTTFVDGYLGRPGLGRRLIVGGVLGGAGVVVLAVRRPLAALAFVVAALAAMPAAVRASGGTRDETAAAAWLAPGFTALFGAGVLRGLALALLGRIRRADRA